MYIFDEFIKLLFFPTNFLLNSTNFLLKKKEEGKKKRTVSAILLIFNIHYFSFDNFFIFFSHRV